MAHTIQGSTPKQDGFFMPAEYHPQDRVWMVWPQRGDNWRHGGKPAQKAYTNVAIAIREFAPVTMLVNSDQYSHARGALPENIDVVEMSSNDAWARDIGPTFVIDGKGQLRGCDWQFNAWGGLFDGLYFPWDKDDAAAQKICELASIPRYRTEGFVLEGGAIHVDGEGTALTTRMCLLSEGRNPHLNESQIEDMLKDYLNVEKVLWLDDGIDPDETTGHIDDIACFVRPGEICCITTDDTSHPFYEASQKAIAQLKGMTDAQGRAIKVHELCCPQQVVALPDDYEVDYTSDSKPRQPGDICIASYANFLICNDGVIVPQYDDINDALALKQISGMFPDHKVVGVATREIVYGGGNIHCITQQQPAVYAQ